MVSVDVRVAKETVSMPSPPSIVSATVPVPPSKASLPAPPSRMFAAALPINILDEVVPVRCSRLVFVPLMSKFSMFAFKLTATA